MTTEKPKGHKFSKVSTFSTFFSKIQNFRKSDRRNIDFDVILDYIRQ